MFNQIIQEMESSTNFNQIKNYLLREVVKINSEFRGARSEKKVVQNSELFQPESANSEKEEITKGYSKGRYLRTIRINAPYDEGSEFSSVKAKFPDGSLSNQNIKISESDKDTGELNLACLSGIWFNLNYLENSNPSGGAFYTTACSYLSKTVPLKNAGSPVFLDLIVYAFILNEKEKACIVGLKNFNIPSVGVTCSVNFNLAYSQIGKKTTGTTVGDNLIDIRESELSEENIDTWKNFNVNSIQQFIPLGVSQVQFSAYTIAQAFVSEEIIDFQNENNNNFNIALLDLRNRIKHTNDRILTDPLNSWDHKPNGGILILGELNVYEAINNSIQKIPTASTLL